MADLTDDDIRKLSCEQWGTEAGYQHLAEIAFARAAIAADRALNAAPVQVAAEPDMRHPKIQRLIGAKARREIELQLVEQLLEDPDFDATSMDMEYWNGLHDKLRDALKAAPVVEREGWRLVPVEPTPEMLREAFKLFELVDIPGYATGNDARRAIYRTMVLASPDPAEQLKD